MNADEHGLQNGEITGKILKVFFEVYNELGHGFLESVYEKAMAIALRQYGVIVETQKDIMVWFRAECVGEFRADLLVENRVIVKLKAVRTIDHAHQVQVLNYLRATNVEVGRLLNFGEKPELKRLAYSNSRKSERAGPSEFQFLIRDDLR